MVTLIRLPSLAANIAEATVNAWKHAEGDIVKEGEPLVEIITSKATFELESPATGVLRARLAPAKSVIPIGYVLGIVAEPGEALPNLTEENEAKMAAFRHRVSGRKRTDRVSSAVRATPGARRLARQAGIALEEVSCIDGTDIVREEDVRRHLGQRSDA